MIPLFQNVAHLRGVQGEGSRLDGLMPIFNNISRPHKPEAEVEDFQGHFLLTIYHSADITVAFNLPRDQNEITGGR